MGNSLPVMKTYLSTTIHNHDFQLYGPNQHWLINATISWWGMEERKQNQRTKWMAEAPEATETRLCPKVSQQSPCETSTPLPCVVLMEQVLLLHSSTTPIVPVLALLSSQWHQSFSIIQENIILLSHRELVQYANLFLLVYFQGSDKCMGENIKKNSETFSNISPYLQRASCLELLLPRLKLETLSTVERKTFLSWQTESNSSHLRRCIPDVSSSGQKVSLFSVFHPEMTFCKWREKPLLD